jgi:hypothetical protein
VGVVSTWAFSSWWTGVVPDGARKNGRFDDWGLEKKCVMGVFMAEKWLWTSMGVYIMVDLGGPSWCLEMGVYIMIDMVRSNWYLGVGVLMVKDLDSTWTWIRLVPKSGRFDGNDSVTVHLAHYIRENVVASQCPGKKPLLNPYLMGTSKTPHPTKVCTGIIRIKSDI